MTVFNGKNQWSAFLTKQLTKTNMRDRKQCHFIHKRVTWDSDIHIVLGLNMFANAQPPIHRNLDSGVGANNENKL